jgi:hypothetical protein
LSLQRVEVVVAGESRVVVGAEIDGVLEKEKEEAELTLLASPTSALFFCTYQYVLSTYEYVLCSRENTEGIQSFLHCVVITLLILAHCKIAAYVAVTSVRI